jgi:hypothetical protein
MDNKVIAGLLAIGLVIGAIATYPLARASQPIRTVTKTRTQQVVSKIENGMTANQVIAHLGQAAALVTKPTATNGGVECAAWVSKAKGQPVQGDWVLKLCVKVQ